MSSGVQEMDGRRVRSLMEGGRFAGYSVDIPLVVQGYAKRMYTTTFHQKLLIEFIAFHWPLPAYQVWGLGTIRVVRLSSQGIGFAPLEL